MERTGDIGEHEVIRRLTARLGGHPLLRTGAGDDCAVVELPGSGFDQVFTTDPVIEGMHFNAGEIPARIGNKAAGRVLSDIAAMGAQPQWLLINVVATPDQNVGDLEQIYEGIGALCRRFGATVIGGDLAQGPCLELHVFGTGMVPSGKALLRSGARPGDSIFVTGPLGCSRAGKHLDFSPRVEEGVFLRDSGVVHAMMDISDGLATDLRHILERSGTGALLEADRIPRVGSLENALYDGEDFELLFTVAAADAPLLARGFSERFGMQLAQIGAVADAAGGLRLRHPDGSLQWLEKKAYEHFRQA